MDDRAKAGLEIDLCRAWTRLPRSVPLRTTTGQSVDVIHLGTWTHGFGPDFRGAMISIDNGPAITGSVEIHLRTRGWTEHRHHIDPRYNDVVLHVVGQDDAIETRRADGKVVPTVCLQVSETTASPSQIDWSVVGGDVCAESIARTTPDLLRDAIGNLGDLRMTSRTASLEADLLLRSSDALLYREILIALGYRQNRNQMRTLANALPWSVLIRFGQVPDSLALLLGAGGFLPLSDVEIEVAGIDLEAARAMAESWTEHSYAWSLLPLPATTWELARMRPQNHPIRRLVQFSSLLEATGGRLANELLAPVRAEADPATALLDLVNRDGVPPLGRDRAMTIATNVIVPFAFAQAHLTGDQSLVDSAAAVWSVLKAGESNERTRAGLRQVAGDAGLKQLTERHMQGLVHLTTNLCEPRRCFECPIARIVLGSNV